MTEDVDPKLKAEFDEAVIRSESLPSQPTSIQLELYGLFKQVTVGDVRGERPGRAKVRARAKFDAWTSRQGMSKEDAIIEYVKRINELEQSQK